MTDMAFPSAIQRKVPDFASDAAKQRLKARYASERRFRFIGLAAILLTASFVVLLIGTIVRQGIPAFTEHRLKAEVLLDPAKLDPKGTRLPADLRAADYSSLARDTLRARFPDVTERRARRKLDGLLSIGAADDLRAVVMANPSTVGTVANASLLLSSNADLFLKGEGARNVSETGSARLRVEATGNGLKFSADEPVFASSHGAIIMDMRRQLETLRREMQNLSTGAGADAKRQELSAQVAALEQIVGNRDAALGLNERAQSVFIVIDGTMLKVTELSLAGAVTVLPRAFQMPANGETREWRLVRYIVPESNRRVSDDEVVWLSALRSSGAIESGFAWRFFTNGDSREPELAGIRGALIGSFLVLLVTLALCLPIGVAAAIYLEEFAPKNRFTDILEVNINNLAAVPSIVFGLLGLAVFLNAFDFPRSAPVVGGLVLALLVLPTIIIASRAAVRAVPPSIREAALGVGASQQQAVFHHVLPLAMPGIMTGTIIGMAHALGETAPLLMIGMVAFIVDIPTSFTDAATALPVQIFLWSDLPELAFRTKTAAAIIVLLVFLLLMNGLAIILRRRFERRW